MILLDVIQSTSWGDVALEGIHALQLVLLSYCAIKARNTGSQEQTAPPPATLPGPPPMAGGGDD